MNDILRNDNCFIIAEAGVNHNGDINTAKKLIDVAAEAGADAVKFQTFKAESLVTKNAPKANYQKETTGDENQYIMLKKLELSFKAHIELINYCKSRKILFLSTPFDFESVDLLEQINIPLYKISSGDITNIPLLSYIARFNKTMIVSTGMSNLGEVEAAIEVIKNKGNNKIILLHCTSNYPAAYEDVNLRAILTLKKAFKLPVGYSDHTIGIEVPIAAVTMGSKIIEKHFTLDKGMKGPDHRASLNPEELGMMINSIRNIEKALGDGVKSCNVNEENTKIVARKSLVAKNFIAKGEVITSDRITIKRPAKGVKPKYFDTIVGKKAVCDIEKDEFIRWEQLE